MGQVVRAGLLVVMGAITYWRVGRLPGAVLLLGALALGVLTMIAFAR